MPVRGFGADSGLCHQRPHRKPPGDDPEPLRAAGGAVLATSGDSEQSRKKEESLASCPTMPPNDPCDKKLDKGSLRKAGLEKMEHSIKIESVGKK